MAELLTVEEYLNLPDRRARTELHHGIVVPRPPAKWGHADVQHRIQWLLKDLDGQRGLCFVEMAFRPEPEYELWQADVGYSATERENAIGDDRYLQGAPDLVVEVLDPEDTVYEINDRMAICLGNGCSSFWVADRRHKLLSVTEGNITTHYGISDTFQCGILPGPIRVREVFE